VTAKEAEETDKEIRVDTVKNGDRFEQLKDDLLILARSRP